MAVAIRISRQGKKKSPFYRIVAADKRSARDGRFIELLGTYHPITKVLKLDTERTRSGSRSARSRAARSRRSSHRTARAAAKAALSRWRSDPDLGRADPLSRGEPRRQARRSPRRARRGAPANVYELEVAESDLGKVIGRGGKTARALRTVVQAVAPRSRKRTLVEILE